MVWYEANGFVDTDREERESGNSRPSDPTRPQGKLWKAGKGNRERWGLCWEQRTARGHGAKEKKNWSNLL